MYRAVGTPLAWPDAKKNANHVREWGIEVRISLEYTDGEGSSDRVVSNYSPFGDALRARNVMRCSGETK